MSSVIGIHLPLGLCGIPWNPVEAPDFSVSPCTSGWWWLEPWNFMTFHFIYGNHNPKWRTPSFFRGVGIPPTRYVHVCLHPFLALPIAYSCFKIPLGGTAVASSTQAQPCHCCFGTRETLKVSAGLGARIRSCLARLSQWLCFNCAVLIGGFNHQAIGI